MQTCIFSIIQMGSVQYRWEYNRWKLDESWQRQPFSATLGAVRHRSRVANELAVVEARMGCHDHSIAGGGHEERDNGASRNRRQSGSGGGRADGADERDSATREDEVVDKEGTCEVKPATVTFERPSLHSIPCIRSKRRLSSNHPLLWPSAPDPSNDDHRTPNDSPGSGLRPSLSS